MTNPEKPSRLISTNINVEDWELIKRSQYTFREAVEYFAQRLREYGGIIPEYDADNIYRDLKKTITKVEYMEHKIADLKEKLGELERYYEAVCLLNEGKLEEEEGDGE